MARLRMADTTDRLPASLPFDAPDLTVSKGVFQDERPALLSLYTHLLALRA